MSDIKIIQVGNIFPDTETFKNRTAGRVFSIEGLSPTVRTPSGGGIIPQIMMLNELSVNENMEEPKIIKEGNYSPSGHNASSIVSVEGIAPTVMENHGTVTAVRDYKYRIRKLTPTECFRLMGVEDDRISVLLGAGISNTQLYKLAGNSIVEDVLYHLFRKMFVEVDAEDVDAR